MRDAPPPGGTLEDAQFIPDSAAALWSKLTFGWMTPILNLGYARPLETTDLWKLDDWRKAEIYAERIISSFDRRHAAAQEYNIRLKNGEIQPSLSKRLWWSLKGNRGERERQWREKDGLQKASLILAMNDAIKWFFWPGGLLKIVADISQITSPLVIKALIKFSTEAYVANKLGQPGPSVGRGVGLAFTLLIMQEIASFCLNHAFHRSLCTGVLVRAGLITAIYSKSLRFTGRSRHKIPSGKLVNHISTDVSRIDFCMGFFHFSWTAPVQLIICLILLVTNIGVSALVGFGLLIVLIPIQSYAMKKLIGMRRKSMGWTDKRAKLLQELLPNMRVLKYFAWEIPFMKRLGEYRKNELKFIRNLLILRNMLNATAVTLPIFAAVASFIVYSALGHSLQAAVIFTSFTWFQLLRLPLMLLPLSLNTIADAYQASTRLYDVFTAELVEESPESTEKSGPRPANTDLDFAIQVKGGQFTWDGAPPSETTGKKGGPGKKKEDKKAKAPAVEEKLSPAEAEERIFKLRDIEFELPKGKLCAVVGPVGSGKSSLLQALLSEMRRTSGDVVLNGAVSYAAQTAWIQGASIRDNILFGRPFDEQRYWKVVEDSALVADLEMFPDGDRTEVGEKGISLSGGQKQRLNIARALYNAFDIVLMDDPFSALDAHVGKHVFEHAVQGSLAGKTRVVVTHALHFLPHVDYIITMQDGRIAERGSYNELIAGNGAFAKFVAQFGGKEEEKDEEKAADEEEAIEETTKKPKRNDAKGTALMQTEERAIGAVSGWVYHGYFKAGHYKILFPLLVLFTALTQAASVMTTYWLVYWEEKKWKYPSGFYMGMYAAIGVSQSITYFFFGSTIAMIVYFASVSIHKQAVRRIFHAPMSFFESVIPLGRIMNRFSKDIDTLDNTLGEALRMALFTFSQILGAIVLISIVIPYFLVPILTILVVYFFAALFYRSSARELKRLDALLRSTLYSHFSESMSGLATIRAYGETARFEADNRRFMDNENRAYWLTCTNQRWLSIRLDFLGSLLTFSVAILTVAARKSISPAQTGVVLSYMLNVQQSFGWMIRQSAEVENDMNSVERVLHYANNLEQEAPHQIEEKKPEPEWPRRGELVLKDVEMSYRPGLPPVLKKINMRIKEGEHVGIVGRTGAGKSSIMVALYRLVELNSGSITLDDVDISTIGLSDLRSKIAIIPQDPTLFSGTLRSNLDPFGIYDDVRLWDALKRSSLIDQSRGPPDGVASELPSGATTPVNRFTLESPVEDGGNNLSVGQRSLVSLARALVKDSRVVLLDEATASVDYETDQKVQQTISKEFADHTILCIAHRIKTIIGYDRICVMDAGQIAELDTPEALFLNPDSIFRSMCDRSGITLADVRAASKERELEKTEGSSS
ncbi:hypothetical protein DL93DRAFT_2051237 [Clavulina sp. PMI_390]|nr:hypothetical protein DL93DRAFT_2051237 [Clavulina sp. PMI_390]